MRHITTLLFIVAISGCSTAPRQVVVWKDRKEPPAATMEACMGYATIAAAAIRTGVQPPPLRQTVVIQSPTEYEGEITSCSFSSCTVELKETRSSSFNRQMAQSNAQMADAAYNAGAAIGAAIAQAAQNARAEREKEVRYAECLAEAGYSRLKIPLLSTEPDDQSWSYFSINNVTGLNLGMDSYQVRRTLKSPPFRVDVTDYGEEHHYCETGEWADQLLAVRYIDGKVADFLKYEVQFEDVMVMGHCKHFFGKGEYVPY